MLHKIFERFSLWILGSWWKRKFQLVLFQPGSCYSDSQRSDDDWKWYRRQCYSGDWCSESIALWRNEGKTLIFPRHSYTNKASGNSEEAENATDIPFPKCPKEISSPAPWQFQWSVLEFVLLGIQARSVVFTPIFAPFWFSWQVFSLVENFECQKEIAIYCWLSHLSRQTKLKMHSAG